MSNKRRVPNKHATQEQNRTMAGPASAIGQESKEDVAAMRTPEVHQDLTYSEWLKAVNERWVQIAREFQNNRTNVWLTVLTGATLVVLMAYTGLTYSLHKSALKQVEAAKTQNTLAQQQIRNTFFLPIVVLTLNSDTRLAVENIGFGPAVNIRDIVIQARDTNLLLYHVSSLRPGQTEPVGAFEGDIAASANHKTINQSNIEGELKRLFPEVADYPGKRICIAYSDANSEWHKTTQSMWFSRAPELKGMHGLVLRFEGIENVGKDENTCEKR